MENEFSPHFTAHLHYEQHPESREAQLMACMALLEQIAQAKDRREAYASGRVVYGEKLAAYERLIKILQTKYDSQIKTLELFGNPGQLEK